MGIFLHLDVGYNNVYFCFIRQAEVAFQSYLAFLYDAFKGYNAHFVTPACFLKDSLAYTRYDGQHIVTQGFHSIDLQVALSYTALNQKRILITSREFMTKQGGNEEG